MSHSTQDLLVGIDVGTSSCRVMVFDPVGKTVAQAREACETTYHPSGRAEIDVEEMWEILCRLLRYVMSELPRKAVRGIGVDAQLGIVGLDRSGRPSLPATTWADTRAAREAGEIEDALGVQRSYLLTGRRISAELPIAKIIWFGRHDPDGLARTSKLLSIKDYVVFKLTGEIVTDETHACYTGMYNPTRGVWESELLSAVKSLKVCMMPDVVHSTTAVGRVTHEAGMQTGLPIGVPVVGGGPDGTSAALGAGVVHHGDAVNVAGTTDVFFMASERPVFDTKARVIVNRYAVPGMWLIGGPMSTTGGCVAWFVDNVMSTCAGTPYQMSHPYELFDQIAATVGPGCDGLVFLPSLTGERTPEWNPDVRGVVFGLSRHHTKAHLARAIYEGSAFVLRNTVDALREIGLHPRSVRIIGGGAESVLWRQIRADVCQMEIRVPVTIEASALGAAMMAGVGTGVFSSLCEAGQRMVYDAAVVLPNPRNEAVYRSIYQLFKRLYGDLAAAFSELAGRRSN